MDFLVNIACADWLNPAKCGNIDRAVKNYLCNVVDNTSKETIRSYFRKQGSAVYIHSQIHAWYVFNARVEEHIRKLNKALR